MRGIRVSPANPRADLVKTATLLFIFLAAFAIKISYLNERRAFPDFSYPVLDSKYHDDWAWALTTNQWDGRIAEVQNEPFFRAPLYPYFLSVVYRVRARDYLAARVVQVLLGSLSVVLVFLLTDRLFGRGSAWLAFALTVGYWPFTLFEAELLIPALIVPLNLVFVLTLLWASERSRPWWLLLPGVVLGLSAIARPNVLIVLAPMVWWVAFRQGAIGRRRALLLVAGMLVVVMPVTTRNWLVGRDFVPISSQGGVNFYIGNNPQANATSALLPGATHDWWGTYNASIRQAENDAGRELKASEVSRYWYRRGLGFMVREPLSALKLMARKAALLLGNGEPSNNMQIYFGRAHSQVLSRLPVNFALILSLAVMGIVGPALSRRREGGGGTGRASEREQRVPWYFAACYALSLMLFFVTSRYRLPIVVFTIPYAAFGVRWILHRSRSGMTARGAAVAIALLVFTASSRNPLGVGEHAFARGYYSQGVAYTHTDYEKALQAFSSSITHNPAFAPAWKMRGWTLGKLGRTDEAIDDLLTACQIDSTFASAYFTLGVIYQREGLHREAKWLYQRALRFDPGDKFAMNNLADICLRENELDLACELLKQSLEIDPNFAESIYGLGCYYERVGQFERAMAQYERVPHLAAARARLGVVRPKLGAE